MPTDLASVRRRAAAHLLDVLLLTALQLVVFLLVANREPADVVTGAYESQGFETDSGVNAEIVLGDDRWFLEGGAAALYIAGVLLLWGVVYGVVQGRTGRTPAKRLLGLRVVGEDGSAPGAGPALVRTLLWVVDAFPWIVPWLTGFLVAQSDPRRQRLGDRVARTVVVRG